MNKKDKKNLNCIRDALRELKNNNGGSEIYEQSILEEHINGKGIHVNNMCSVMNEFQKRGFVTRYGTENSYSLNKKL